MRAAGDDEPPVGTAARAELPVVEDFDKGDFVILCCDGVWECFDNEQMMFNFIFENLNKNNNGDLDKVIGYMFDNIIGKNSQTDFSGFDNMSCIVIQIK